MTTAATIRIFVFLALALATNLTSGGTAHAMGDVGGIDVTVLDSLDGASFTAMDIAANGDIYVAETYITTELLQGLRVDGPSMAGAPGRCGVNWWAPPNMSFRFVLSMSRLPKATCPGVMWCMKLAILKAPGI